MKKSYNKPTINSVMLYTGHLMQAVSASGSLSGTSYGGSTSESGITTANSKQSNLWDDNIEE